MAEVHQLILSHGVDTARRQAVTKHERLLVEAAYQVLSEDAERMGFCYSGFALTSLPHKPQTEGVWTREGHNFTLVLQSGTNRTGQLVGLPYGSYARFILLFLQTEAIRTSSREIEMGKSMRMWLGAMGLSIGGTTYRLVNEQARRIGGCNFTFFASGQGGVELQRKGAFVEGALSMMDVMGDQPTLWQERVLLNETFFRELREHPVPVSEAALRAIGPRSMVIDVYIWLAYRLHSLTRDVEIGWPTIQKQFGGGFALIRKFRAHFTECLALAMAAYPEARVSLSERGIVLHPSRPAVTKAA
jgi:hypothetical protein